MSFLGRLLLFSPPEGATPPVTSSPCRRASSKRCPPDRRSWPSPLKSSTMKRNFSASLFQCLKVSKNVTHLLHLPATSYYLLPTTSYYLLPTTSYYLLPPTKYYLLPTTSFYLLPPTTYYYLLPPTTTYSTSNWHECLLTMLLFSWHDKDFQEMKWIRHMSGWDHRVFQFPPDGSE